MVKSVLVIGATGNIGSAWKAGKLCAPNSELKKLIGREPRTFDQFVKENKTEFLPHKMSRAA